MKNISGGVSVKGAASAIITTGSVVIAGYSMYKIYKEITNPKSNIGVIHLRY